MQKLVSTPARPEPPASSAGGRGRAQVEQQHDARAVPRRPVLRRQERAQRGHSPPPELLASISAFTPITSTPVLRPQAWLRIRTKQFAEKFDVSRPGNLYDVFGQIGGIEALLLTGIAALSLIIVVVGGIGLTCFDIATGRVAPPNLQELASSLLSTPLLASHASPLFPPHPLCPQELAAATLVQANAGTYMTNGCPR